MPKLIFLVRSAQTGCSLCFIECLPLQSPSSITKKLECEELYELKHSDVGTLGKKDTVVTDLNTTLFIRGDARAGENTKAEISPHGCESSVPLRLLLASYIQDSLPRDYFDLDVEDFALTQGAPNDPDLPKPSDEEVFATRRRHADFDRFELSTDWSAAEQFLRWKVKMRERTKLTLIGATLTGETHGFARRTLGNFKPRYALEKLPEATEEHLRSVKRKSYPYFEDLLGKSSSFRITLIDELTRSEGTEYARVFTCRVTSIDERPISPSLSYPEMLCIKIFDDSTGQVPDLKESLSLTWWSQDLYTADDFVRAESNAYSRLGHAWGSLIPWFYGAHNVSPHFFVHLFATQRHLML